VTTHERLATKPLAGAIIRSAAPALVDVVVAGGLDFVLVDHMHGPLDWETSAAIARAAKAAGLLGFFRPSGSPETGGAPAYLAAQCQRALSVGFDGLFVSIFDRYDIEAVLGVADRFWQRNLHAAARFGDLDAYRKKVREQLVVIAQFESLAALEHLEEVASLPGLDGLAVANSDVTLEATGGLDAEDDRVLRQVERVARACRERSLLLWCNTGYGFAGQSAMSERGRRLIDRGADLILFQSVEFILTNALRDISTEFRGPADG
jgi:4-hydroxy-2-oxoheptanedioate aldolase